MKSVTLLFLVCLSACASEHPGAGSRDHYANFADLAAQNRAGVDYQIELAERPGAGVVMAFHGGLIEPGTTELARSVARDDLSFYTFMGLKNGEANGVFFTASDLHLTSAHFDEPSLLALARAKDFGLALHGYGGEDADFCVGGANAEKRRELVASLRVAFPALRACELCCDPYNGVSKKNPVNLCARQGVQVEMSPTVRRQVLSNQAFMLDLAQVLRGLF